MLLEYNLIYQSQKIKDIQWFLDDELLQRYDFVKNFISVKNSTNHSIVFFGFGHSGTRELHTNLHYYR